MSARDDYPALANMARYADTDPVTDAELAVALDEIDRLRDENERAVTALGERGIAFARLQQAVDAIPRQQVPTVLLEFRSDR